jgi:hypothetical protein
MLAQLNPACPTRRDLAEHRLAVDQRQPAKVGAVQFEQVEGVEDHVAVAARIRPEL